jgi:hypothetical protein
LLLKEAFVFNMPQKYARNLKYYINMKFLTIALLLVFGGCTKVETVSPQPVLGTKLEASVATELVFQEGLKLKVTKIEDSRCPKNVTCVWAGMARVFFTLSDNAISKDATVDFESKAIQTIVELGSQKYVVEVSDVLPYPQDSGEVSQNVYKVVLLVKKG